MKKSKVLTWNNKRSLIVIALLILGLMLRLYFSQFGNTSGDLQVFAEWGDKIWKTGLKSFYFDNTWYYSRPTYPPISSLMYGGIFWLYERRYVLAQIHNSIKVIPAVFIIWFGRADTLDPFQYGQGYFLLLKLPGILADVGISWIIFKIVADITKSWKKGIYGMCFYLFNPVSIFVSSIWGQTESLIGFFGLLAFVMLYYNKAWVSLPALFVCLFIKPTWIIFLPLFIFLLLYKGSRTLSLFYGLLISLIIYLVATIPFTRGNILIFTYETLIRNMLPTSKGAAMLSVSAFNLYTIFVDFNAKLISDSIFRNVTLFGWLIYAGINLYIINYIKVQKNKSSYFIALFLVGAGSFLFMSNMLERYFYAAFIFLGILLFIKKNLAFPLVTLSLVFFINLVWSFYRRTNGILDSFVTGSNFFVVKILSVLAVASWVYALSRVISFKSKTN